MNRLLWTKAEYLAWLARRSTQPHEWDRDDCINADNHIEHATLLELEHKLRGTKEELRVFVVGMARAHFGSAEVDELMVALGCYPSYMNNTGEGRSK